MGFEVMDYIQRKSAGMYALCNMFANVLENEAKKNATWTDRTAHARQSLHGGVEGGNNEYSIYLAHGTEYGTYLETGTGIYGPKKEPIKPKNKKALYWKVGEDKFFAKEVKGIKPMPIIEPTLEDNKERIRKNVIDYWGDD